MILWIIYLPVANASKPILSTALDYVCWCRYETPSRTESEPLLYQILSLQQTALTGYFPPGRVHDANGDEAVRPRTTTKLRACGSIATVLQAKLLLRGHIVTKSKYCTVFAVLRNPEQQ